MIVKFFSKPEGGGSGGSSVDYLLNKEKHNNKIQVLQGNPELSRQITQNLDFATPYTVGCLSFEEGNLPHEQKLEIMTKFEQTMFAGLEKEQYNILWVEHTDKDRLELNFFIPNVELTSGKRLQPYYDKADRPLTENFKQVTNHDYDLSDPNNPQKQKTLITKSRLPKAKKETLEAINKGIDNLVRTGGIKDRKGVIKALEGAGFEIARVTPRNLSIKTEGQNLRLKGAFYDENFRGGESLQEEITGRSEQYQRERSGHYQTARKRLDTAVSKREQEFRKRYPNRTNQINQEITENIQHSKHRDIILNGVGSNRANSVGKVGIQQNHRVETVSRELSKSEQITKNQPLHSGRQEKSILHRNRHKIQGAILGRQRQHNDITNQSGGLIDDRNRKTTRESIERVVERARTKLTEFGERIRRIKKGKQLDTTELQRNNETKQTNQRTIKDIEGINQEMKKVQQQNQDRDRKQNRDLELSL